MSSNSKTRTVEADQEDTSHSEYTQEIDRMDDNKSLSDRLKESDIVVAATSGFLVALIYSVGSLSSTIWGGPVYLPGLFAGLTVSLIYTGRTKEWILGGIAGSASALPLLVAAIQLHVTVGATVGLFGSVLLSIISAAILGMIGSYVYSYLDKNQSMSQD